jgi:hypothetical protein
LENLEKNMSLLHIERYKQQLFREKYKISFDMTHGKNDGNVKKNITQT